MIRRIVLMAAISVSLVLTVSLFTGECAGELNAVIEKIFVKGDRVFVALRRSGNDRIAPEDYPKIMLRIETSKGPRQWSLAEIDKTRAISTASGRVEFDTGIILEKSETVKAVLSLGRIKKPMQETLTIASATSGARLGSASVIAGIASHDFPARITRISGPVYPGVVFSIYGVDFGRSPGQVRWVTRPPLWDGSLMGDMVIASWSDTRIEVKIAESWAGSIREPRDAALHVWPHRVEERTTLPLSTEGEGALRYPYSGSEGPMMAFQIQPRKPIINTPLEVTEGEEFDVRGRFFGDEPGSRGSVYFSDYSIPFTMVSWGERVIRVRMAIIPALHSGDTRTMTPNLTVTNKLGLSASERLTIHRAEGMNDIEIRLPLGNLSYGLEGGRAGGSANFIARIEARNVIREPVGPVNNVNGLWEVKDNSWRTVASGNFTIQTVTQDEWSVKEIRGSFYVPSDYYGQYYLIVEVDPERRINDVRRTNNRLDAGISF
jgi:hypothetical protein